MMHSRNINKSVYKAIVIKVTLLSMNFPKEISQQDILSVYVE